MERKTGKIKETPNDYDFRKKTSELINLVENEIIVTTGEFSIYYYPDVRQAFRDAWHKGVPIKAYLGKCDEDTVYRVVSDGIAVYQGNNVEPKEHFMVVDNKHWIKSESHEPCATGKRHGPYAKNDPEEASKKRALFDSLIKGINPINVPIRNTQRAKQFLAELYK